MIPVPEPAAPALLRHVAERIGHELNGGRGVGDENQIEMRRVGAEEGEGPEADRVDHGAGELGGEVGAVRVAVEVGLQFGGEAGYEGAGVDCGAAVV